MSSAQPDQACKPRKLPWTGHSSPLPPLDSDDPKALPLLLEATTSPGEPGWIWPCCSPKDDSQVPAWLFFSELQPTEEERRWLSRAFSKWLSSLQARPTVQRYCHLGSGREQGCSLLPCWWSGKQMPAVVFPPPLPPRRQEKTQAWNIVGMLQWVVRWFSITSSLSKEGKNSAVSCWHS